MTYTLGVPACIGSVPTICEFDVEKSKSMDLFKFRLLF